MNVHCVAGRLRLSLPRALCTKGNLANTALPAQGVTASQRRSPRRESELHTKAYSAGQRVMASAAPMVEQIKEKNEKYPVMIYAKSYCPFCGQVKGLFKKLQVDFQAVNLDEIHEGEEIQDELAGITGSHTVPQVFIKGEFIGGCDETMSLNRSGGLKEKLEKAGISATF